MSATRPAAETDLVMRIERLASTGNRLAHRIEREVRRVALERARVVCADAEAVTARCRELLERRASEPAAACPPPGRDPAARAGLAPAVPLRPAYVAGASSGNGNGGQRATLPLGFANGHSLHHAHGHHGEPTDPGERVEYLETYLVALQGKMDSAAEALSLAHWLIGGLADALEGAGVELEDTFDEERERLHTFTTWLF